LTPGCLARHVSVTCQVQNTPVNKSFTIAIDRSRANAINSTSIRVGLGSASGFGLSVGKQLDQAMYDLEAMENSGLHPELNGLRAGHT
jgi:hypothetical protein